jgi:hypothetical protein
VCQLLFYDSTKGMTPSLLDRALPAIDEVKELGSIEVVEDTTSGKSVDRIVCLPPEEHEMEKDMCRSRSIHEDEEEEGVEVPESIPSRFMDALLYSCTGYEACGYATYKPFKGGILKHPNRAAPPVARTVSWSSLEIREFNMTLGDHPSSTSGPPVMLDMKPLTERTMSLDEYERLRSPRRKRRQLKLSYRDRKGILEQGRGFSTEEVNRAWEEALKIRQQRNETLRRGLLLMTLDDAWESAQRKYHRLGESIGLLS